MSGQNLFTIEKNTLTWRKFKIFIYVSMLVVFTVTGCDRLQLPQLQQLAPLPAEPPCRIAILPFANESSQEKINYIVYKIFLAEFLRVSQLEVVQEGDIKKLYRQLRIFPGQQPNFDQIKIIANRLDSQLIITGVIIDAQESFSGTTPNPSLTFSLQIIDAPTGRTIWNTYHKRNGQHYQKILHFGVIASLSGLARKMSQEIIDLWIREGLMPCLD
ncbi:MAG TPA: hypothetical protein DCX54_02470 [Flavobacteriales bacterium]|nr:hypothetical protein [Flavobacteriales bacterium]